MRAVHGLKFDSLRRAFPSRPSHHHSLATQTGCPVLFLPLKTSGFCSSIPFGREKTVHFSGISSNLFWISKGSIKITKEKQSLPLGESLHRMPRVSLKTRRLPHFGEPPVPTCGCFLSSEIFSLFPYFVLQRKKMLSLQKQSMFQ